MPRNHWPETALVHAGSEAMMDPASSAMMILLWCSPDMLFFRRPPTEAPDTVYSTVSDCEGALRDRLATAKVAGRIAIGRCHAVGKATTIMNWGISPSRELLTSLDADIPAAPALPVDPVPTGSTSIDGADSKYTTVRVTRGTGRDAATTAYIVERSN
jgi:hypothetical protein